MIYKTQRVDDCFVTKNNKLHGNDKGIFNFYTRNTLARKCFQAYRFGKDYKLLVNRQRIYRNTLINETQRDKWKISIANVIHVSNVVKGMVEGLY